MHSFLALATCRALSSGLRCRSGALAEESASWAPALRLPPGDCPVKNRGLNLWHGQTRQLVPAVRPEPLLAGASILLPLSHHDNLSHSSSISPIPCLGIRNLPRTGESLDMAYSEFSHQQPFNRTCTFSSLPVQGKTTGVSFQVLQQMVLSALSTLNLLATSSLRIPFSYRPIPPVLCRPLLPSALLSIPSMTISSSLLHPPPIQSLGLTLAREARQAALATRSSDLQLLPSPVRSAGPLRLRGRSLMDPKTQNSGEFRTLGRKKKLLIPPSSFSSYGPCPLPDRPRRGPGSRLAQCPTHELSAEPSPFLSSLSAGV